MKIGWSSNKMLVLKRRLTMATVVMMTITGCFFSLVPPVKVKVWNT